MTHNHSREGASSRFHFQQVSASRQNMVLVDVGCQRCQRCQQCLLLRLRPPQDALMRTPLIDYGVVAEKREQTRSSACPESST